MSSRIIRVLDVLSEQNVRLVHVTRASERNSNGNRMPDMVYRRQESQRMGEIEIDHKFHARRWVICVSRAYVHVASFRKLGYYPGWEPRRGRRWKTHLNFFPGCACIFSVTKAQGYRYSRSNNTPARYYDKKIDTAGATASRRLAMRQNRNLTFDTVAPRSRTRN